jgi:hypothetical protein
VAGVQPRLVAILGLTAYRTAFGRPKATIGLQPETIGGRPVWILPNPSGLNAHYRPADFARLYGEARAYAVARSLRSFAPRTLCSGPSDWSGGPDDGSRPGPPQT